LPGLGALHAAWFTTLDDLPSLMAQAIRGLDPNVNAEAEAKNA
jgi:hypothetical protein